MVKITKCKMKAKDILEIEIGIKNLNKSDVPFEERQFVLRFLNKMDPNLTCKGRIVITGSDITKLQGMQFAIL